MFLLSGVFLTACNSGGGSSSNGNSGIINLAGTYTEVPTLVAGDNCPQGTTLDNVVINANNQYCGVNSAYCYSNPIDMTTTNQCFSGVRLEDNYSWDTTFNNCSVNNNGVFSFIESIQFSDDYKRTFTTCYYSVVMTKK